MMTVNGSDIRIAKRQGGDESVPSDVDSNERLIRLHNDTGLDLTEVLIFFPNRPDKAVSYGSLRQGEVSVYKPAKKAYPYAHIEAKAGDRQFVLRPIDYVGETELTVGKFTYILRIGADRLNVTLERDN